MRRAPLSQISAGLYSSAPSSKLYKRGGEIVGDDRIPMSNSRFLPQIFGGAVWITAGVCLSALPSFLDRLDRLLILCEHTPIFLDGLLIFM